MVAVTTDVIYCRSKSWGTLVGRVCTDGVLTECVVPFVCLLSFTIGVLTEGVVLCVGVVSVIALGRSVGVLAFIVIIEVCVSSNGSVSMAYCERNGVPVNCQG